MKEDTYHTNVSNIGELISEIKKLGRYRVLGFIFLPVVSGLFILKHINKKIYDLEENIKHELSKELNYLEACNYIIEKDDTYLVHSEKTEHITDCKDFLENLNSLKKYQKILSQNLNSDIDNIIFEIDKLQKKIEEHYKLVLEKIITQNLKDRINEIQTLYNKILKEDTYLIYSEKIKYLNTCKSHLHGIKLIDKNQDSYSSKLISSIDIAINKINETSDNIEKYNTRFVERRKKDYNFLFKKSPFPLDDKQKTAIIKDDKHNLVVAGAGSGKTEVLTTRIAYLIARKDKVKSNRILALAFQRDASKEMKDRLKKRYDFDIKIKTFHSLGLEILKKAGIDSEVYGGNNYEKKFRELIYKLYKNAEKDTGFRKEIISFLKMRDSGEVEEKTIFATKKEKEEHYDYMRNLRYRTLDDSVVKSMGEREIMNFFLTHKLNGKDVKIIYEEPAYWGKWLDDDGIEKPIYPDFYLPDFDIYIEHWSHDKNGKLPPWYENDEHYKTTMNVKKNRFKEHDKTLVETCYGDFKDNPDFLKLLEERILDALHKKFPDEKFEFKPIEHDELVDKVWRMCKTSIDSISENISRFIITAKTYGFTPEKVEKRLEKEKWSPMQNIFGRIAVKIYRQYQEILKEGGYIDFEDMINRCIDILNEKEDLYYDLFDHILIDEYQDISKQRHILVETLMNKNPNCKLFCVGDDWQSIMSFAGSDLKYFVNFDKYFPHRERTDLTTNYRSIKSIVDTGTEIIKNNSGLKLEKDTNASIDKQKPINVYLSTHKPIKKYVSNYYDHITDHCLKHINNLLENGYDSNDILLLTRIYNNQMLKERLEGFIGMNSIPFKSVHRSKGLQSRAVFILDVRKGLYGFPCELENPKLLEIAKEEKINSNEEEERRLFYVAVTRAKEDVYIYSQKDCESKFLNEISQHISIKELNY